MAVHQLIPSFKAQDASGQAALHFQLLLRRLGLYGEIYAGEVGEGLEGLARPASALKPEKDDLVLYHHGIASGLSSALTRLECRRGVVYHNISPARFYAGTSLEEGLLTGRAQLAAMASAVELAIGVSDYNARELTEAGYRNVRTVPLFVEPERFALGQADPRLLAKLQPGGPAVLSVSRIVPHKRFEDLLSLHEELLKLRPDSRLLLVGGFDAGSAHFRALRKRADLLPGVTFLGRLGHPELVAAYRAASVFVSMSEHEGFGVPLIEAMAAGLPVLAFAAAAVPETLGGSGLAFTGKDFPVLAEVVRELCDDAALREKLIAGQYRRLEAFSAANAEVRLGGALESVGITRPRAPQRSPRRRPKVGLIVQRYGEVSGGAEKHARDIAIHLAPHADVRVLTSCARDHLAWDNAFAPGPSQDGAVEVLRFRSERQRDIRRFNALSRKLFGKPQDRFTEERWLAEQGPLLPGLLQHLASEGHHYDAFVAFTYLYAPTVWGLPLVAKRTLLVPTAHDEPPLQFGIYADVFERPRALLCNTPEELALIDAVYPRHARGRVVGVGVDAPEANPERFRAKHGLDRPYLFYVGRLEAGKGIPALLKHHASLWRSRPDAPELLLAGEASMRIEGQGVRALGRISEQDKHDALAGALAVVIPSRYESLSLLALEAFAQGTPVLVNAESAVLRGQVERSQAGACYRDAPTFAAGLEAIQLNRAPLATAARAFAERHRWSEVIGVYREEIGAIVEDGR